MMDHKNLNYPSYRFFQGIELSIDETLKLIDDTSIDRELLKKIILNTKEKIIRVRENLDDR